MEDNQIENTVNKKWMIIGVVVLILIAGAAWYFTANSESEIISEVVDIEIKGIGEEIEPLKIITLDWPPHIYIDENGRTQGIGAEVLKLAFAELDIPYEINIVPWARAIKEAETGESDAILFTAYVPEREAFLYYSEDQIQNSAKKPFSPTYITISDPAFFVRKLLKESIVFDSIEQIDEEDYRVGAVIGYSSAKKLREKDVEVIDYPDPETAFQALSQGGMDMYLLERAVGLSIVKDMGLENEIIALPQSFFANPQYMPFSKNSDYPNKFKVWRRFLEEVEKIHESGGFDEIYNSYIE